jgi:hypothetical protein
VTAIRPIAGDEEAAACELRDYIVRGAGEILMRKTIAPLAEFAARPTKEPT